MAELRYELELISNWIAPDSRILDLGCGDGELLAWLQRNRRVTGYGLEIDPDNIDACIRAGVNVIQADLNQGLDGFDDGAFDAVVMTQALQALNRPDQALAEMLRVGRRAIVTFPNFGHWRARLAMSAGRMPVTPALPHHWYDSPNIHLCTVHDFEVFCRQQGWHISQRVLLNRAHREGPLTRCLPNLLSQGALYQLQRN